MKGDFSRWTFRQQQHYHGVLKQQGRVDLDSDWNEQGAITSHRIETEALDVIGQAGAPQDDAGFMIQAVDDGTKKGVNLSISTGRAYVDGILCENDGKNVLIAAQPAIKGFTVQPDLPGFQLPTTPGTYIAYLEVWERHVTFLDDNEILEVALGGPDTCTRARTVWQVHLLQAAAAGASGTIDCSTDVPAYDTLIAPSSGTLQAQAQPTATTDPCMVPATAGFRSLENQLYRVEIHDTGTGDAVAGSGTATFKWSRDNGSVVASWIAPPSGQNPGPNTLFIGSAPKDIVLGFTAGEWIELSDDSRELNFKPGTLVQLTNVQGQVLTVDPTTVIPTGGSLDLAQYPLNPKIRRWDSAGRTPVATSAPLDLENGIQVQFAAGTYNTGDYWLIPARTLTANIDWPVDGSGNPLAQPPKGIHRHYCRLAIVQFDGKVWSVAGPPCLPIFPPLTNVTSGTDKGVHITDVRTAVPDQPLLNDSNIPLTAFEEFTIKVLCDAPLDPVSVKSSTCLVTLDISYPVDVGNTSVGVWGLQPLVVPAAVSVFNAAGSSQILLTLNRIILDVIRLGLLTLQQMKLEASMTVHLNLKGDFIWAKNDPALYLDGDVFGVTRTDADGSTHIGLRLPSGDGKRGGNFDMWFRFVLPVTLASLSFSPNTIDSGQSTTGTLTLTGPAPAGGAQITFSSNNPILGNLPPVTIQENQSTKQFQTPNVTLPAGVGSVTIQVTATYGSSSAPPAPLTVNTPVKVNSLSFTASSVMGGIPATLNVSLNVPALAGGAVVTLSTTTTPASPVPAATVPTVVNFSPGQTTVPVTIQTTVKTTSSSDSVLTVTGTLNGTASAKLTITAPRIT
jgi:hypothetical protein